MFIDFLFEQNHSRSDLAKLQDIPEKKAIKIPKKYQKSEEKKEL